jgi:hypothetical protein
MRRPKSSDDNDTLASAARSPERQREKRQPYATEVEDYAGEKAKAPSPDERRTQSPPPARRRQSGGRSASNAPGRPAIAAKDR